LKLFWLILAGAGFFLVGHAVAVTAPAPTNWGWHHYGHLPPVWRLGGIGLAVLTVVLAWTNPAGLRRLRLPVVATATLVVLLGAVMFWIGRERTFFLGDGQLLIDGFRAGRLLSYNEPLSLIGALNRLLGSPDPAITFAIVSVASGSAYLLLAVVFARHVAASTPARVLVFAILASAGFVRLFFGYVETYPLLAAFVMAYAVLGVRYLEGRGSLWPLVVLAAVAVPLHVTALALFPSLVFLVARGREGTSRGGLRWLVPGVPLALALGLLFLKWPNPARWIEVYQPFTEKLHPLPGSGLNSHQAYHVFSSGHLGDFFQEQMLLGPFGGLFLLAALLLGALGSRTRPASFLLWAGLPWWAFSFFYSREIGAARDWDLFAAAAIPLLLAFTLMFARHRVWSERPARARIAGAVVVAVGVFHTLPWVAIGTHHDIGLTHFVSLFSEGSRASRFARSYAFETVSTYYFYRKDFPNAEVALAEAHRLDPDNLRLGGNLGSLRLSVGKVPEAIEVLEATIRREPDNEFTRFQLANAYLESGRYGDARRAFREVLERNDGYLDAYINLARLERLTGDPEVGAEVLQRAHERFPGSGEVLTNLGLVYQDMGRLDDAVDAYRRGLELHPADFGAAFNLGLIHMKREEYAEAEHVLEDLLESSPRDLEAWINLGVARNRMGENESAFSAFEEAVRLDDMRGEPYFNMAQIHLQEGRRDSAIAVLQSFTARDSTSSHGRTAKAMIRRLRSGP
jgi:tetratricopeptide (TPR) repeat protein